MKKINSNEVKEESTFMRLWHNKRTHAAMVLGLWMIFLLFVMLISFVGGEATQNENLNNQNNQEQKDNQKEFKDYALMQSDLLKNNYKYEYNIQVGEYQVIYKGEKIDALETGYRENAEETIRYYVDETGLYKVVLDDLNAFDKLYENINESYIDLEYIFDLIKDKTVLTEEKEDFRTFTYTFVLDTINYEIKITTDLNNITDIYINFEDKEYNLKYSEVNSLEKLSYEVREVN